MHTDSCAFPMGTGDVELSRYLGIVLLRIHAPHPLLYNFHDGYRCVRQRRAGLTETGLEWKIRKEVF